MIFLSDIILTKLTISDVLHFTELFTYRQLIISPALLQSRRHLITVDRRRSRGRAQSLLLLSRIRQLLKIKVLISHDGIHLCMLSQHLIILIEIVLNCCLFFFLRLIFKHGYLTRFLDFEDWRLAAGRIDRFAF